MQLRAVAFIHGLSTSRTMREVIIASSVAESLLKLTTSGDVEIQMEVLGTLCNLSLNGLIGSNPGFFLERVHMDDLISFLCSSDSTYRLFGALAIGNIASVTKLQESI